MSAKRVAKEIGSQIAHALVSAVILLPCAQWPAFPLVWPVAGFLVALIREDAQHRTPDLTPEGWGWIARGFPFAGRWLDLCGFAVGGLGAWAIARAF